MINTKVKNTNIPFSATFEVKLARPEEKAEIETIIKNWMPKTTMIFQNRLERLEKDILQINPGENELYTLFLSVDKDSYKHEDQPRLGLSIEPSRKGNTSLKLGISDTPGVGTFTDYHRDSNIFRYGLTKINEIKQKIILNSLFEEQAADLLKWNKDQSSQTAEILRLPDNDSITSEIKNKYLEGYKKLDITL